MPPNIPHRWRHCFNDHYPHRTLLVLVQRKPVPFAATHDPIQRLRLLADMFSVGLAWCNGSLLSDLNVHYVVPLVNLKISWPFIGMSLRNTKVLDFLLHSLFLRCFSSSKVIMSNSHSCISVRAQKKYPPIGGMFLTWTVSHLARCQMHSKNRKWNVPDTAKMKRISGKILVFYGYSFPSVKSKKWRANRRVFDSDFSSLQRTSPPFSFFFKKKPLY